MYGVCGKFLNGIKIMHVNSLACVGVKVGESECFRIDSGVIHDYTLSPRFFNVYMNAVLKEGSE